MKPTQHKAALASAVAAARAVGKMMRENRRSPKKIQLATQHDIKLELDVRGQKRIEKMLRSDFPDIPILGEEGILGDPQAPQRWVVDPIDGTVNFTYGIPHACVSIALQQKSSKFKVQSSKFKGQGGSAPAEDNYQTTVGVIYDPFTDELWTAVRGQPARLNGRVIHVSRRRKLEETIVSIGFAKEKASLESMLPVFNRMVHRVRKIRMMGAAALGLAYVGAGRMDAYLEGGLRLWDIAAGGLIIECAGGEFWREPVPGIYKYRVIASNGLLRGELEKVMRET